MSDKPETKEAQQKVQQAADATKVRLLYIFPDLIFHLTSNSKNAIGQTADKAQEVKKDAKDVAEQGKAQAQNLTAQAQQSLSAALERMNKVRKKKKCILNFRKQPIHSF